MTKSRFSSTVAFEASSDAKAALDEALEQAPEASPGSDAEPMTLRTGQRAPQQGSEGSAVPTAGQGKSRFGSTVAFESSPLARAQLEQALEEPVEQAPHTPRLGQPLTPGGSGPQRPAGKSKLSRTVAFESPLEKMPAPAAPKPATQAFESVAAARVQTGGPAAPRRTGKSHLSSTIAFEANPMDIEQVVQQAAARAGEPPPAQVPSTRAFEAMPDQRAQTPQVGGTSGPRRTGKSHLSSTIAFEASPMNIEQAVEDAAKRVGQPAAAPAVPGPAAPPAGAHPVSDTAQGGQRGTQAFGAAADPSAPRTAGPQRTGKSHLSSTLAFVPEDSRPPTAKPRPAAGQAALPGQAARPDPAATPPMPPVQGAAPEERPSAPMAAARAFSSRKKTMMGGVGLDAAALEEMLRPSRPATESSGTDPGLGQPQAPAEQQPPQQAAQHAPPLHATPPPWRPPPQHAPPQHAPPQHAPPQHAPPQHAPPQHATPPPWQPPAQPAPSEHATPPPWQPPAQHAPPQHAPPQHALPEHALPEHALPEHALPEHATPPPWQPPAQPFTAQGGADPSGVMSPYAQPVLATPAPVRKNKTAVIVVVVVFVLLGIIAGAATFWMMRG